MLCQWRKCSGIGWVNDILGEGVPFNYPNIERTVKGYLISEPNGNHDKLILVIWILACVFVCSPWGYLVSMAVSNAYHYPGTRTRVVGS